jgi:hypothetical protein
LSRRAEQVDGRLLASELIRDKPPGVQILPVIDWFLMAE